MPGTSFPQAHFLPAAAIEVKKIGKFVQLVCPEAWHWQKREEYGNKGQGTPALDTTGRAMWILKSL